MIIGHQKQWDFLKRQAQLSRVPHAFLFSGEEKLGKKTMAFEFLKLLNCQEPDFLKKPCGTCVSCKAMEKGTHPDFFFVKPEKETIGISQIRELTRSLSLRPYFQWKGAILDKAHSMTREAQNCLLKTLEEPKGKTCQVLISEHPSLLAETIVSRTQEIRFFPVKKEKILDYLMSEGIQEAQALKMTEISFGKPGLAKEFLLQPEKMEEWEMRIEEFLLLSRRDLAFRFQYAKSLSSRPEDLKEVFNIWLSYLRSTIISQVNKESSDKALKTKRILEEIAGVRPLILDTNINTRLALENLFLKI